MLLDNVNFQMRGVDISCLTNLTSILSIFLDVFQILALSVSMHVLRMPIEV